MKKKTSKTPSAPAVDRAAPCSPPLLSVEAFESACSAALIGNLWEDNFNPSYTEHISLSVSEMRYLANMLRLVQSKPQRVCFTPCCEANEKTLPTDISASCATTPVMASCGLNASISTARTACYPLTGSVHIPKEGVSRCRSSGRSAGSNPAALTLSH